MTSSGLPGVTLAERDHVCAFYRGSTERDAILRAFFGAGFAVGDKCLCIADAVDTDGVAEEIRRGTGGPARPDQLSVLPAAEYLTDGRFVPERTVTHWEDLIGGCVDDGFERVRGTGELSWVLREHNPIDPLLQYESLCNVLVGRQPVTILCLYDLDRFGGDVVAHVLDHHPAALARGVLFRAPRPDRLGETSPGRRPWRIDDTSLEQALLMANLLMSGARTGREIGELLVSSCLSALPVDMAAVVRRRGDGTWSATGRLDGAPLPPGMADSLAQAAGRSEPAGPAVGWPVGDLAWTAFHPLAHAGSFLGWLAVGTRSARSAGHDQFLRALAVQAPPHLRNAQLERDRQGERAGAVELARQLLDGDARGPDVVERARSFGLELGRPVRAGVVRLELGSPADGPRPDEPRPDEPRPDEPRPDELSRDLVAQGVRLVATRSGEVAFVVQDSPAVATLLAGLAGPGRTVGLGRAQPGADGAARSYRDARQAAEVAAEMGRPIVRYDDMGLFRVLAAGGSPALMEGFVDEWLGPLFEHDRTRRGDLAATLAAYLDGGANQLAAAEALGIHVSTLKYRLARIAEVSGRDPSSPDDRFQLQAALHMRRTLIALGGRKDA